jgi:hypothetical protein
LLMSNETPFQAVFKRQRILFVFFLENILWKTQKVIFLQILGVLELHWRFGYFHVRNFVLCAFLLCVLLIIWFSCRLPIYFRLVLCTFLPMQLVDLHHRLPFDVSPLLTRLGMFRARVLELQKSDWLVGFEFEFRQKCFPYLCGALLSLCSTCYCKLITELIDRAIYIIK